MFRTAVAPTTYPRSSQRHLFQNEINSKNTDDSQKHSTVVSPHSKYRSLDICMDTKCLSCAYKNHQHSRLGNDLVQRMHVTPPPPPPFLPPTSINPNHTYDRYDSGIYTMNHSHEFSSVYEPNGVNHRRVSCAALINPQNSYTNQSPAYTSRFSRQNCHASPRQKIYASKASINDYNYQQRHYEQYINPRFLLQPTPTSQSLKDSSSLSFSRKKTPTHQTSTPKNNQVSKEVASHVSKEISTSAPCVLRTMDRQLEHLGFNFSAPYVQFTPDQCIFRKWKILSELGSGTFAKVFRLKNLRTGEIVAGKFLEPYKFDEASQQRIIEMFAREIKYSIDCQCPSILPVKKVIRGVEGWIIIQELVEGGTLWDNFETPDELSRFGLFIQLTQAVIYMQSKKVVHRDLKPTNILRSADGKKILVTDFGWSETFENLNQHMHELPGTIEINPPEVLRHRPHQTEKIDNYAVAMNLLLITSKFFVCREANLTTDDAAKTVLNIVHDIRIGRPFQNFSRESWDIFLGLSHFNPEKRMSMSELIYSPWFLVMLTRYLENGDKINGYISRSPWKEEHFRRKFIWHSSIIQIVNQLRNELSPAPQKLSTKLDRSLLHKSGLHRLPSFSHDTEKKAHTYSSEDEDDILSTNCRNEGTVTTATTTEEKDLDTDRNSFLTAIKYYVEPKTHSDSARSAQFNSPRVPNLRMHQDIKKHNYSQYSPSSLYAKFNGITRPRLPSNSLHLTPSQNSKHDSRHFFYQSQVNQSSLKESLSPLNSLNRSITESTMSDKQDVTIDRYFVTKSSLSSGRKNSSTRQFASGYDKSFENLLECCTLDDCGSFLHYNTATSPHSPKSFNHGCRKSITASTTDSCPSTFNDSRKELESLRKSNLSSQGLHKSNQDVADFVSTPKYVQNSEKICFL